MTDATCGAVRPAQYPRQPASDKGTHGWTYNLGRSISRFGRTALVAHMATTARVPTVALSQMRRHMRRLRGVFQQAHYSRTVRGRS